MKNQTPSPDQQSFIFNVELLVEGKNNAEALEQLLHALSNCNFLDYRILSGIQLGQKIDERKSNSASLTQIPVEMDQSGSAANRQASITKTSSGFDNIRTYMKNNTLIRLIVNKGLGIKLNIPCRIINIDEGENLITVYHVDEKQVYTFRLNEIEDFST
ncbi:hypothetical protein [Paenibacillus sp. sgz302251]|uniref:hypothetical protein n=1 Tax=Paenibacillus sp. sgz302251 TaxID=3414493 RepID=UPI003C7A6578